LTLSSDRDQCIPEDEAARITARSTTFLDK
jgi:hypothetical protein